MSQPLTGVQQIIKDTVDAAREREFRKRWVAQQPPHDDITLEALRLADEFDKKWSGAADELLVQLKGCPPVVHCEKLAELLRPARLYVSLVRLESGTNVRHPTDHTACFVHVTEPELLEAHLVVHTGKTATLVKTY